MVFDVSSQDLPCTAFIRSILLKDRKPSALYIDMIWTPASLQKFYIFLCRTEKK